MSNTTTSVFTKNVDGKVERTDIFADFNFSSLHDQCHVRNIVGGDYEIKRLWEEFSETGRAQGITADDKIIVWSNY